LTVPGPRQQGIPLREGAPRRALQAGGSDERHTGFRWVGCDRCGAAVQAAKFSPQHTVVQWNPESVRACAEFAAGAADGRSSALIEGCGSLRGSIDRAVLQGRLEVSPP
jgi:hypothetical protein